MSASLGMFAKVAYLACVPSSVPSDTLRRNRRPAIGNVSRVHTDTDDRQPTSLHAEHFLYSIGCVSRLLHPGRSHTFRTVSRPSLQRGQACSALEIWTNAVASRDRVGPRPYFWVHPEFLCIPKVVLCTLRPIRGTRVGVERVLLEKIMTCIVEARRNDAHLASHTCRGSSRV